MHLCIAPFLQSGKDWNVTMKQPGFQLNNHSRKENVPFESHDPSMMYDPVSGWYYSYSTDSAITSEYRQGIPVRKSKDLIEFEFVGYALSDEAIREGRDNGEYRPTGGFWAPYVEYVNGEYRMYYSATKAFGSSESRIWLAVAKHPEGPFENRGVVVDTWGTTDAEPNGIDPHVTDTPDGRKFFIYGSFFGGIYVKELCRESGLSLDRDVHALGKRIAHKPENSYIDGPEGAAVMYHPQKRLYYLFLSYGWLGDDYDIRVGISASVEGPYVDREGKCLDGESLGQKLAGSYCFSAKKPFAQEGDDWQFAGFRGPGHGVPFYAPLMDRYFFVHHVRDGAKNLCRKPEKPWEKVSYRMHYLVVRAMYFAGNWPVFSPEPFAGEAAAVSLNSEEGQQILTQSKGWEWLLLSNGENEISMAVCGGLPEKPVDGVTGICYDYENSKECRFLAAYTQKNEILWAKTEEM